MSRTNILGTGTFVFCAALILTTGTAAAGWGTNVVVDQADAVISGGASQDYAGYSVSIPGDLNGDGFADAVVSAFGAEDGGRDAGKVWITFGGSAGIGKPWLPDVTLIGPGIQARAGWPVSAAGDANGDGLVDLAVEASGANGGKGAVYLLFGKRSWPASLNLANADVVINGGSIPAMTCGTGGDVNGDGIDDVVIGGQGANSYAGAVAVVLGRRNWPAAISADSADGIWLGERADDRAGTSVAVIGDVNGDGFDDIATGAPRFDATPNDNTGKGYVIFGSAALPRNGSLANADFALTGTMVLANFASVVERVGDINRDGLDDVAFASPSDWTSLGSRTGTVNVVFGRTSGWDTVTSADVRIEGEERESEAGSSLAAADVTGDGIADLVIGARWFSGSRANRGKVYVVPGATQWPETVPLAGASDSFLGYLHYDGLGVACAAGDLNGDGVADLAMGAYGVNKGSLTDAGEAYVFYSDYELTVADTDGDGIPDALEAAIPAEGQTNMWLADSDGDGLDDGVEDANRNGRRDPGETDARNRDSDGDGVEDGVEVLLLSSDPLDPADPMAVASPAEFDKDGDALPNSIDPDDTNADVDGDGFGDGYEAVMLGLDAVTQPNLCPVMGDTNNDGLLDNWDAFLLRAAFLGLVSISDLANPGATDVVRDGYISNLDALAVQMFFLDLLPVVPPNVK